MMVEINPGYYVNSNNITSVAITEEWNSNFTAMCYVVNIDSVEVGRGETRAAAHQLLLTTVDKINCAITGNDLVSIIGTDNHDS